MARRFSYFDDWRNHALWCECGWRGPLRAEQAEPGASLLEFCCPDCDTALAFVTYPSNAEMLANPGKLSEAERADAIARQQAIDEAGRLALRHPEQLPDLAGASLVLTWDFVTEGDTGYTVIRHQAEVVWRERAIWEGVDRFGEVATLLAARYGGRLRDLAPTEASVLYLHGDKLTAADAIERIRARLRSGAR